MNKKKQRLLIIFGVTILVLLFGLAIFTSLRHRGETKVNVRVAPEDSTITLDGQPAKSGTLYLKPGSHTFKASRQYFTDATETVNTKDLTPGQDINLLPGADSPEALLWLEQHPESQVLREGIGAEQATEGAQNLLKQYPFIKNLPYKTLDYKIDYSFINNELQLQITLYPVATSPGTELYDQQIEGFKRDAQAYLKSQKVDLEKTKIEYKVVPEE